jgi:hypothetical protein
VEAVVALLMMLAGFGVGLATWVHGRIKLVALWCLWYPLKRMCKMILQIEWEVYLAVALAAQVSRFLPGVGGEVGRELDMAKKPLYVVFWGGGEGKRIATGAVLHSGIM